MRALIFHTHYWYGYSGHVRYRQYRENALNWRDIVVTSHRRIAMAPDFRRPPAIVRKSGATPNGGAWQKIRKEYVLCLQL